MTVPAPGPDPDITRSDGGAKGVGHNSVPVLVSSEILLKRDSRTLKKYINLYSGY